MIGNSAAEKGWKASAPCQFAAGRTITDIVLIFVTSICKIFVNKIAIR